MYNVALNEKPKSYFNVTLFSYEKKNYLNIYINKVDGFIAVQISKSNDGIYFESPCSESNDLVLDSSFNLEETYYYVKGHFISRGYTFSSNL